MRWSFVMVAVAACSKSEPPSGLLVEPPPPAIAGPAVVETTLAEAPEYRVALGIPEARTMFQLSVTPQRGWKINPDYPAKLVIAPHAGCELPKPIQRARDAVQLLSGRATWQFDLGSCGAGPQQLAGDLKFAVCTDKTCAEKTQQVAIALAAR